MKRILALILSMALLLGSIPAAFAAEETDERPALQTVAIYNFDDGSTQGVYGMGSCSANVSTAQAHSVPYSLYISNRTETWNAGQFDMSGQLKAGNTYRFSAYVYHECETEASFQFTLKVSDDQETGYQAVDAITVPAGEWGLLSGEYTVNAADTMLMPYVELTSSLDSYYIDDIRVDLIDGEVIPTEIEEDIISLKDAFDDFTIGATIGGSVMSDPSGNQLKLLTKHFDTFAIENQLKAQYVLDYATSVANLDTYNEDAALSFAAAIPYLEFAKENGMKVNAQTLVWHSMTPEWFFHEDYDVTKPFASRELMLTRLENYVEGVLTWCETNYPDLISYWIVVNEAIADDNNSIRQDALWYATVGEDYVAKTFEFANKYKPEGVDFLYNDYNMEASAERTQFMLDYLTEYGIIEKGWVDAFGFQAHIQMGWPGTGSMKDAMRLVDNAGLRVYVTELDIKFGQSDINNYEAEYFAYRAQKDRYIEIFTTLMGLIEEGIDIPDITLWGLNDSYTWLTSMYGEAQYPMLFDKYNQAKLAYYGLLEVAGLAESPENLALNCDGAASGQMADNHAPKYAFDGDISTRWASQTGDKVGDYWIYVDLGEAKKFNFIKIKWEDCYGKKFYMQYANENPENEDSWTTFADRLIGGGEQSIFTDEFITARYVRMFATEKSNDHWGCSIWEMGVYYDETIPENPYNKDPNSSENYAIDKAATASSVDGEHTADLATDGNKKTRWCSAYSDPQWITVDLGEEKLINRVILRWEAAYAKAFSIKVSTDNENWKTVYLTDNGKGGVETLDFNDVTARYVKMDGTARGTNWAYSIYEFEVYYVTRQGDVTFPDPENPDNPDNPPVVPPVNPDNEGNLALGATVVADSVNEAYNTNTAEKVNDGDVATRWQSNAAGTSENPAWIYLDFGMAVTFDKVNIVWELARSSVDGYTIEYSNDAENWLTVVNEDRQRDTVADPQVDTAIFDAVTAQYVRIYCTNPDNNKGSPSIYELRVYNTSGEDNPPVDPPVPTVTPEDFGLTIENNLLLGISANKTAADFEGLTFDTENIGTGTILTYNEQEYVVIVMGDVNGDGKINSTDFMQIRKKYLGLYDMNGNQFIASDVNGDGKINSTDFMQVRKHFLGLFTIGE